MNRQFFSQLLPGTVLWNRYRLVKCINASDEGGIYLCQYLRKPSEYCAVKIYRNDSDKRRYFRDHLVREFRLSQMVKHPHLVSSHHFFEDEDFVAFTMPYLPGGSLAERLAQKRRWSASEIVAILAQLASGIAALHDAGVFHRDIKPENILFDANDVLQVADLGIGSAIQVEDSCEQKYLLGTPQYWAPEYISKGRYDARADIFAIGVVGYELLTGKLPPSVELVINGTIIRVLKPLKEFPALPAEYPAMLRRIIERCLQSNPDKRFHSVQDLARVLSIARVWAESEACCEDWTAMITQRREKELTRREEYYAQELRIDTIKIVRPKFSQIGEQLLAKAS